MTRYEELQSVLRGAPRKWLVTGAAGFIGSNLVEALLRLDQSVVGLDSFATGHRRNLEEVRTLVGPERWAQFSFLEGDICRREDCAKACSRVDYVLHQAALGSVPRSIEDPVRSHVANVDGFLNMLVAARDAQVKAFVYASSSSVYGDHPVLPKVEANIGRPLSPYAATKLMDEIYADVFARCYGMSVVGLRYFNVFGRRQDPEGAYAAVIPRWFAALLRGGEVVINGDGQTSRDFCYVENVVQANLLAATTPAKQPGARVFNIACGARTTLVQLFDAIKTIVAATQPKAAEKFPTFGPERPGDVRHSLANIEEVKSGLGYGPTHDLLSGLQLAAPWYVRNAQMRS
jgi:UDP-N-acetylglucosamine 4-epimerase